VLAESSCKLCSHYLLDDRRQLVVEPALHYGPQQLAHDILKSASAAHCRLGHAAALALAGAALLDIIVGQLGRTGRVG
jgi:hypothetical protein